MARMQISAADSGKSLAADVGDELVVSLPENPTTGYRWQVDSLGSSLVLERDDFALPRAAAIGAEGTRLLTFRATTPGHARLQLALRRDWEKKKPPMQDFSLSVDVQPR